MTKDEPIMYGGREFYKLRLGLCGSCDRIYIEEDYDDEWFQREDWKEILYPADRGPPLFACMMDGDLRRPDLGTLICRGYCLRRNEE